PSAPLSPLSYTTLFRSDRRHDLDQAFLHRDFDAEAAEFTARGDLHVAEALGVHVARMRIEPGQHAVDRRFDELGVVGLLDVVGADRKSTRLNSSHDQTS